LTAPAAPVLLGRDEAFTAAGWASSQAAATPIGAARDQPVSPDSTRASVPWGASAHRSNHRPRTAAPEPPRAEDPAAPIPGPATSPAPGGPATFTELIRQIKESESKRGTEPTS
jgi:hypothetical protein